MLRVLLVLLLALAAWPADAQLRRTPLLVEGAQTLTQRVILRPGTTLHPRPDAAGPRPIPGFSVLHVYARAGEWIEVGREATRTDGWVREAQTIPWRHTMVAAFTNRAGRERAFFTEAADPLRAALTARNPAEEAARLRATAGQPGSPVTALEPEAFVDISRNFYLLPILSAEVVERPGLPSARLLEVASAPAERRAAPDLADPALLRDFRGGVLFLVDTTISMQPYIERTQAAIRGIVARLSDTVVRDTIRFGMVAYRGAPADRPGVDYITRIIARPDLSQPIEAILPAIDEVRAATGSTDDFNEDAIAGLRVGLDSIDWTGFGFRTIVLITDAGALPADDPKSQTRLGIPEIRALAESRGVALFAIHLLTPEGRHNHAFARGQYTALTRFGAAGSLYFPVPEGSADAFGRTVESLAEALLRQIATAVGRPVGGVAPPAAQQTQIDRQVELVATAMRLAYLGRVAEATAPDIVRSFAVDRDWRDPTVNALDVRLLLTRNQLSDLSQTVQRVLDAGLAGRTDPATFFAQLRAVFAATARDPSRLANLQRVGEVMGEYLQGLPYRSAILDLTEADWMAMGAAAQRELINGLEAKLRLYQDYAARTDLWVTLDGRTGGEAFFPVPLDALP
jgi:serine/threonine-protein kinase PpkA